MEHWYALHTKPRKEHQVHVYLAGRGIQTYLPMLTVASKRSPRRRREEPFFARYLFARVDLSQIPLSSLNWMPGMDRVVSFGGQPAPVPDAVIRWLDRRLGQMDGCVCLGGLPLQPNDRVRIVSGPLRGVEALFDRKLSSEDRARVLVDLLGRLTACEIDLACLERA